MSAPGWVSTRQRAILNLRIIAATAEKLAVDLEGNSLWEGDAAEALAQIDKARGDIRGIR